MSIRDPRCNALRTLKLGPAARHPDARLAQTRNG